MIDKQNRRSSPHEIQCLQMFRGIAAIVVLLYHVGVISQSRLGVDFAGNIFMSGAIGVDFFFVLSGFIIFHAHRQDLGNERRLPRYLLKRFFRIWPLLAILTTIKLIYLLYGPNYLSSDKKSSFEVIICSYFMLPVPFELGGKPILDVAWTLAHEMLFYMVFAVGIALGKRTALGIGILWTVMIGITSIRSAELSHLTAFLFNSHALEFIFGCVVSELTISAANRFIPLLCLLLSGIGMSAGLLVDFPQLLENGIVSALYWGVTFSLLIYGSVTLEARHSVSLPRIATFPGVASYSIYLIHTTIQVPLITILGKITKSDVIQSQIALWIAAILSLIAGIITYLHLEKTMQKYYKLKIDQWSQHLA